MPGEVADIALMTDRLELPDSSSKIAVSPLGPVIARAGSEAIRGGAPNNPVLSP